MTKLNPHFGVCSCDKTTCVIHKSEIFNLSPEVGWKSSEQESSWKDEYCKKFGLCKENGKCQCLKELRFIQSLLDKQHKEVVEEMLSDIEEYKQYSETYETAMVMLSQLREKWGR